MFIEPNEAVLPPYGAIDVKLEAVADLWGSYEDSLICLVMENEDGSNLDGRDSGIDVQGWLYP